MSTLPPPPFLNVIGSATVGNNSHSGMDKLKPSIIIIILILAITVLVSISLCLLLRHLNRRCLRHLSTITTVSVNDSHRHASISIIDTLPLFTYSSVNHPSTSPGGDCAVCLSKFEPHDQLRLLPLCCHAFHANCIDTWLETNMTCPLCRSPINQTDLIKAITSSNSLRLEIGSVSRRQSAENQGRSYSLGSFDYVVDDDSVSDIAMTQTHHTTISVSDKDDIPPHSPQPSLVSEIGMGTTWLDRLSVSLSFRSSGRFFTGSSRRTDAAEYDLDANQPNRVGEDITEFFRWFAP